MVERHLPDGQGVVAEQEIKVETRMMEVSLVVDVMVSISLVNQRILHTKVDQRVGELQLEETRTRGRVQLRLTSH